MIHTLASTHSVIPAIAQSRPVDAPGKIQVAGKVADPAKKESSPVPSEAPLGDRLVRYANYGAGAAGSAAGVLAFPHQISLNAPRVIQGAKSVANTLTQTAKAKHILSPVLGPSARFLASGALKAARGTEVISKFSMGLMQMPVVGRLTSPAVAKTMTGKVLPAANAVGAALAIADNSLRFVRAHEKGNTTGQVVAGIQVGLNAISGVAGFLPGKAQWVAAGAGLTGLGLEMAHQLGGLGK
ncbi:MAG: hypothetical protein IV090_17840 [Candidatus Sericytochromatia bacterium]|nr:hypothetical protein [Candidatus Sericytochromatia bacterium]